MKLSALKNTSYPKICPKYLIYDIGKDFFNRPEYSYRIFSTKGDKAFGAMCCHPTYISSRPDYEGKTLAIDFIESKESGKGYGSQFIKFAKILSNKQACNGYLILRAVTHLTPEMIPHIFYRKQGFSTLNNKIDKKLDLFISKNKTATNKDFLPQLMYYPPLKIKTFKEYINKLKKIF